MTRRKEGELQETERLVVDGKLPPGSRVGVLNFSKSHARIRLPEGLTADGLNLEEASGLSELPARLKVKWLRISKCPNIRQLPADLECKELQAVESGLREIPSGVRVEFRLDVTGCLELRRVGDGLGTKSLHFGGCSGLEELPEGLDANFLTVGGCTSLFRWPETGHLTIGGLSMRDCPQLGSVPPWMGHISQLNLSGCAGIKTLPERTMVTSWIDVAGTQLQSLPRGCQGAALRWRGVYIDQRIAFQPDTIHAPQVLEERNAEMRRVLLERMGYARFMEEARAEVVDRDRDSGGERKLVRVPMEGDESLVCVMVRCPSTGREYVIRVPPSVQTCRKAAAWIAGFDDEKDYRPLVET